MLKFFASLAPLAMLAACNQADAPAEPIPTVDAGTTAAASPEAPKADKESSSIPARFLGVWDYVGGTCAPESDMRMEIRGREIRYYESVGTVAGIDRDGDDSLIKLEMSGEGEEWSQTTRLSLSDDGKTLSVTDGDKPKVKDEYPLKKCP